MAEEGQLAAIGLHRNETAAAIGAQLAGGPTAVPHGVFGDRRRDPMLLWRKVPRSFWGDSPVQATDGGQEVGVAQIPPRTSCTKFYVRSGAPPLGPPTR